MSKTTITTTIFETGKRTLTAKERIQYVDENGRQHTHTHKLAQLAQITAENTNMHTDLFNAVCEQYVPQFVYTCLKTNYAHAPHSNTLQLMQDCIKYAKKHSNRQLKELENDFNELRIQETKTHLFRYVKQLDGTLKRIECIPYVTLELTENGKRILSEYHFADDTSINDLLQTAHTALLELNYHGIINTMADFWTYRSYVYRKVNNYLMEQRSFRIHATDIDSYNIKAQHRISRTAEKRLERIDNAVSREQLKQLMLLIITKNTDKRQNSNLIYTCFVMSVFNNLNNCDIAKKLELDEKQVRRNLAYAQKILSEYQNGRLKAVIMDIAK